MCYRLKYNWSFLLILLTDIASKWAMHSVIIVIILTCFGCQRPMTLWVGGSRLILSSQDTRELGRNALDGIWKTSQWYSSFYFLPKVLIKSRTILVVSTIVWWTAEYVVVWIWFMINMGQTSVASIIALCFIIFVILDLSCFFLILNQCLQFFKITFNNFPEVFITGLFYFRRMIHQLVKLLLWYLEVV